MCLVQRHPSHGLCHLPSFYISICALFLFPFPFYSLILSSFFFSLPFLSSCFFLSWLPCKPVRKAPRTESRYPLYSSRLLDLFMYISLFSQSLARGGSIVKFSPSLVYRTEWSSVRQKRNGKMWHARTNSKRRPISNGYTKRMRVSIERNRSVFCLLSLFCFAHAVCPFNANGSRTYENKEIISQFDVFFGPFLPVRLGGF